jgi:hypothetical protein
MTTAAKMRSSGNSSARSERTLTLGHKSKILALLHEGA